MHGWTEGPDGPDMVVVAVVVVVMVVVVVVMDPRIMPSRFSYQHLRCLPHNLNIQCRWWRVGGGLR